MSIKVVEKTKTVVMHPAQNLLSNTATFGSWVDTQDHDSAEVVLNIGQCNAPVTMSAILYEKDSWTDTGKSGDSGAVPVTGANFGVINGDTDARTIKLGAIEAKNYKRYLALRLQANTIAGTNPTIGVSACMILGNSDTGPSSNAPVFDVDGSGN